ncbi:MAG: RidA family protein [Gemmataceae bacterium]|nr:RidA family protein [Gemmataceae bacterium]
MIRTVSTPGAPAPAGHYSQATVHNGIVYVAGQLAIDPATGAKRLGEIEEQTEQALRNVAAILEAAGSSVQHVLKVTVYISDGCNCVFYKGNSNPTREKQGFRPFGDRKIDH